MEKKILITGGLGFIASHLVNLLLEQGNIVVNVDNVTYAADYTRIDSDLANQNYHFLKKNVAYEKDIDYMFSYMNYDIVYHMAAHTHVDNSIETPLLFTENIQSTSLILEQIRKREMKLVYMSTDEVMGDLEYDEKRFDTNSPLKPSSPYSATKASGEMLVRAYKRTYGINASCLRATNAYGPKQHKEKLIPKTITNSILGNNIPVYGSGQNVRDWIFVEDLVEAIVFIGNMPVSPEVINVGSGNEKTNIDLVNMILNLVGNKKAKIEFVKDRLGHDKRYAINPKELALLGWTAHTSFEEGIEKTIEWYKSKVN